MSNPARIITVAVLFGLWTAETPAEIYACEGDDGITSYQDQPCPEPAAEDQDTQAGQDAARDTPPAPEAAEPVDPELVAACKKRYRDEIDRIDAEIHDGFTAEKREAYREQARALSQQLSRCGHGPANTTRRDTGSEPAGRDL